MLSEGAQNKQHYFGVGPHILWRPDLVKQQSFHLQRSNTYGNAVLPLP